MNNTLSHNIVRLYGKNGKKWLENLPLYLKQLEVNLRITVQSPFPNLGVNFVAPVRLIDGGAAVLKCSLPNKELTTEIEALIQFAGESAVKLINANANDGWLLMEKVEPGINLATIYNDDEATRIAANMMQKLWKPIKNETAFPTIATWLDGFKRLYTEFKGDTGPFPRKLIDLAYQLSRELLKASGNKVLLHGDLHHYNILLSKHNSWLAIDPKGVIGEPEYEVGAFMKNPMPRLIASNDLKKLFLRHTAIIAEMTKFDQYKILAWSFVVTMLSAWWTFEDGFSDIEPLVYCGSVLANIIRT